MSHKGKSVAFKTEKGRSEYQLIHDWVVKQRGKANSCEFCGTKKAKTFDWALKKGFEYERNLDNFIQLCRSCHRKYDDYNPERIPVRQFDMQGEFIEEYRSVSEAAAKVGITKSAISNVLTKRCISAGGYIWRRSGKIDKRLKVSPATIYLTHNGITKSMCGWSIYLGGGPSLVCLRLKTGWSLEEAISTPARHKIKNKQYAIKEKDNDPDA